MQVGVLQEARVKVKDFVLWADSGCELRMVMGKKHKVRL